MKEVHGYPARARQFFIVLFPILITQISLMAPGFFNTVMAGHISKEDLAGVAVGASIFFPVFGAFIGLISGLTPVIAQHYGAGHTREIRSVVQQSFCWATLLAVWVATQLRERSERNKNPPAMRVEDKKLYKKHLSRLY